MSEQTYISSRVSLQSDETLLAMIERDSSAAFEILYTRYKNKLIKFCTLIVKSEPLAEDIVQELFIKIWQTRKKLNTGQSFSFLLYTMARNQSINWLRSAKRSVITDNILLYKEEMSCTLEAPDHKLIFDEYEKLLNEAIARLPLHKQEIFRLSREDKLTHKEIGALLSLSPHTIQSHISDSLQFIKDYFLKYADIELYAIFVVILLQLNR